MDLQLQLVWGERRIQQGHGRPVSVNRDGGYCDESQCQHRCSCLKNKREGEKIRAAGKHYRGKRV